MSKRKRAGVSIFLAALLFTAGCQDVFGDLGSRTSPTNTPSSTETAESLITSEPTRTSTSTPTTSLADERRKSHLEEFAHEQQEVFRERTNLTNVEVFRESGTANLTVIFNLSNIIQDRQEREFELTLRALVQSQYNWIVDGDETYKADYITVSSDYGTGTISADLIQRYINGSLNRETVSYVWAGKFDRFDELGDLDNQSHTTRSERLEYTAQVLERTMESEKEYVRDVETAIQDETLFVKYEHTEDSPHAGWPIEDTAFAYRDLIGEFGVDYMPYNGVRGYDYFPNGSADATFVVKNSWVTSELVGLRPEGEASLRAFNSIEPMESPHDGPP